MTYCEQQYDDGRNYIVLEGEPRWGKWAYKVSLYAIHGGQCSYPEKELTYADLAKAKATFRRWVRKVNCDEIANND